MLRFSQTQSKRPGNYSQKYLLEEGFSEENLSQIETEAENK
jgi:hypothetical protein